MVHNKQYLEFLERPGYTATDKVQIGWTLLNDIYNQEKN